MMNKLLDAHKTAQEVLYGKQMLFEYRDRPSKHLARVLSDYSHRGWNSPLEDLDGKTIQSATKTLEAFRSYFQKLYTTDVVEDDCIEKFFEGVKIPKIVYGHLGLLEHPIDTAEIAEAI